MYEVKMMTQHEQGLKGSTLTMKLTDIHQTLSKFPSIQQNNAYACCEAILFRSVDNGYGFHVN